MTVLTVGYLCFLHGIHLLFAITVEAERWCLGALPLHSEVLFSYRFRFISKFYDAKLPF